MEAMLCGKHASLRIKRFKSDFRTACLKEPTVCAATAHALECSLVTGIELGCTTLIYGQSNAHISDFTA